MEKHQLNGHMVSVIKKKKWFLGHLALINIDGRTFGPRYIMLVGHSTFSNYNIKEMQNVI